jgi:hypothetical protein
VFEDEYRGLLKVGQWEPAKNKTDKKAPAIHPGSTMDEINTFIKSKVQSEFSKMHKTKEKDEGPKGGADTKSKDAPKKGKKEVVCFACGKKGHFKGEGKCKPKVIVEYEKTCKYPRSPAPTTQRNSCGKERSASGAPSAGRMVVGP